MFSSLLELFYLFLEIFNEKKFDEELSYFLFLF